MPTVPPTNSVTVAQEGESYWGFYVPAFEIRIKDRKLPRDVVRDVMQITYRDNVNDIDSFELTINNWDARVRDFKYVGIEGNLKPGDPRISYEGIFDPGQEVEVWMGYADNLRLMMTGEITTLEPSFPQSGAPTLAVRGLNVLHQLRRKQYTDFWPKDGRSEIHHSDIARDIGQKVDPDTGKKRFPLSIRIDENARSAEPPEHHVFQNNQHDILFLLTLARRRGYVVFVEEAVRNGQKRQQLYFGPSESIAPEELNVAYTLEWGKTLIQCKPTLTTANQVGSVTVRGWDRKRKQAIAGTVHWREIGINRDLGDIEPAFNARQEIIADLPIYNRAQAKEMAKAILKDRVKEMLKASGSTVGLPDLRAGRKVFIEGLGDRFSGTYFVTDTTHTINDNGYVTTFNARREQEDKGGQP